MGHHKKDRNDQIVLSFLEGQKIPAIAVENGISATRVRQILQDAAKFGSASGGHDAHSGPLFERLDAAYTALFEAQSAMAAAVVELHDAKTACWAFVSSADYGYGASLRGLLSQDSDTAARLRAPRAQGSAVRSGGRLRS